MLIKVRVDNQTRSHVLEAVNLFRARVVDVVPDALVIEVTGDTGKIQAFLRVLEPFGINLEQAQDMVMTARVMLGWVDPDELNAAAAAEDDATDTEEAGV